MVGFDAFILKLFEVGKMNSITIMHYGIPGQKWGVRRYQNEDGSLTPAGKKRYSLGNLFNIQNNTKTTTYTKSGVIERTSGTQPKSFNPLNIQDGEKKITRTELSPYGDIEEQSKSMKGESKLDKAKKNVEAALNAVKNVAIKARLGANEAVKKAVEKGKQIVSKVLDTAKNAAVKVKDIASAFGSKLEKALGIEHYTKSTTYTPWGDIVRESGPKPKPFNPLNIQDGKKTYTRLDDPNIDKKADKSFVKTLKKKWPY